MKKLLIFDGGLDLRQEELDYLQTANREVISEIMQSEVFDGVSPFVIRGVNVSIGGGAAHADVGSILWNGEVYLVDDQTVAGSGTLYWAKSVVLSNNVVFENASEHQIYQDTKLVLTWTNPSANGFPHASLNRAKNNIIGEIKMLANVQTNGSFDGTGLGAGIYKKWAIANGQNGTVDLRDRFIKATNTGVTGQGTVGGAHTRILIEANLPPHHHAVNIDTDNEGDHTHSYSAAGNGGNGDYGAPTSFSGDNDPIVRESGKTTGGAGSHAHNVNGNTDNGAGTSDSIDIQPKYMILVFIQKIA